MTAARRPGFDPDVWNGTKPMVARPPATPITVGSIVWEKSPEQRHIERTTGDVVPDNGDHDVRRRGGIVARIAVNPETGEQVVTVLEGRRRQGRYEVFSTDLDANDVDGFTIQARTARYLHRTARQICEALSARPDAHIVGYERWLLECAMGFVLLAEEDALAVTAAHQDRKAGGGADAESEWEANRG